MEKLIRFKCRFCGKRLKTFHRLVGRNLDCPKCTQTVTVPEPEATSPPPIAVSRADERTTRNPQPTLRRKEHTFEINTGSSASIPRKTPTGPISKKQRKLMWIHGLLLSAIAFAIFGYHLSDPPERPEKGDAEHEKRLSLADASSEFQASTTGIESSNDSKRNGKATGKATRERSKIDSSTQPVHLAKIIRQKPVFPVSLGNNWWYRLQVPRATSLPINPYFVDSPGLLSTSNTHGMLRWEKSDENFNLRITEILPNDEFRVGLGKAGKRLWLPPLKFKDIRGKTFSNGDFRGISLYGVIIDKPKPDGLIVGHVLGRVELPKEKPVEMKNIKVEAGSFDVLFCEMDHAANGSATPRYFEQSWIAPGVGIVKYVILDAERKEMCCLELVSYEIKPE